MEIKSLLRGISIAAIANFLIIFVAHASDDTLPSSALPLATIVSQLQEQGYTFIYEVEFDDGLYQAKVLNQQGQEMRLQINPKTGKLNSQQPKNPPVSMLQAIETVQQAGYQSLYDAELEYGVYKVKAHDKQGNKVKIYLSDQTGDILRVKHD